MSTIRTSRRGYAMMMVLVFLVMFLAFLGVAMRRMAGLLRTETVHAIQVQRDQGSIHALARALTLLETGLPPTNPYVCAVTIVTSTGSRSLTVTFTRLDDTTWTVKAAPTEPGDTPVSMPSTFFVP